MNNLMFILGSGIMENPIMLRFVLFLTAAIILGLIGYEAFKKADKPLMFNLTCVFAVACMICFFVSVYYGLKLLPEEKKHYPRVEKMEYENHEYLIFREKFSVDVIHNPECECRKFCRTKEK